MITVSLQWIAEKLGAKVVGTDDAAAIMISKVSTDTRESMADALFIALKGKNFDAHEFIDQAAAQGAKAVVCQQPLDSNIPQLIVEDSRYALPPLNPVSR